MSPRDANPTCRTAAIPPAWRTTSEGKLVTPVLACSSLTSGVFLQGPPRLYFKVTASPLQVTPALQPEDSFVVFSQTTLMIASAPRRAAWIRSPLSTTDSCAEPGLNGSWQADS